MTIPLFLCQVTTPLPVSHLIITHNPTPVNKIFFHIVTIVCCVKRETNMQGQRTCVFLVPPSDKCNTAGPKMYIGKLTLHGHKKKSAKTNEFTQNKNKMTVIKRDCSKEHACHMVKQGRHFNKSMKDRQMDR